MKPRHSLRNLYAKPHILKMTLPQKNSTRIKTPYPYLKDTSRRFVAFSYTKVYKLITLGTKFKNLSSLGGNITMFLKFITNYIEQG